MRTNSSELSKKNSCRNKSLKRCVVVDFYIIGIGLSINNYKQIEYLMQSLSFLPRQTFRTG
jgi:hypothetical protein